MRPIGWPLLIKVLVVVGTVIALIFIDDGDSPLRSPEQRRFEEWWVQAQADLRADLSDERALPTVTIRALSPGKFEWTLAFAEGALATRAERRDRVVRILELLATSNVFSLGDTEPCLDNCVRIEVTAQEPAASSTPGSKSFVTSLSTELARQNFQIATTLKLFESYAALPLGVPGEVAMSRGDPGPAMNQNNNNGAPYAQPR